MKRLLIFFLLLAAPAFAFWPFSSSKQAGSVILVNATNQSYDFYRPWSKRPPVQYRGVGVVLPGGRVLTTAEHVANCMYLELEKPGSSEKSSARVEVVDYDCNLALLKADDPAFLAAFKPLDVGEPKPGDELTIWQLEANGTPLYTRALLTTAEVSRYPVGDIALLLYQLSVSLQPREGFTFPVVHNGKLVGLLMRFDSRTQTAEAIPAPVIRHFLKAATLPGGYVGFPRTGLSAAPLRDPQLRRYAGLTDDQSGIYITHVAPDGPAQQAGIDVGDVVTAIDGISIDQDGNYLDARYGKLSARHLFSCERYDGDKLSFSILRQGQPLEVTLKLAWFDPAQSIIEPYTLDKAPRYYILGGLVFQELSRQYLREWGADWTSKAPDRLVYCDVYQDELFPNDPRRRIVILSGVLPTPCTVGYEQLNNWIITHLNGVELKDLDDIEDALAQSQDGFHRIRGEGHPGEIIIDAVQARQLEDHLKQTYGLPSLKRL